MHHYKVSLRHGDKFLVEADRVVVKEYGLEFLKLQPDGGPAPGTYDVTCFVPLEQLFFVKREDDGHNQED